ncbi:hypothetical protein [Actinorugispora endophytica]|uniref:Uncharacterized protein n=1 Tax=Actinorugispora endophytica TaxID=1605990 RepID=A0A4R6UPT7_9ACTN|nr:hypothetical protein [Actinorugispora endophytica]TDQ49238.1 hypothetical protein EV190_11634 [Actinorugispora endophytica]
MDLIISWLVGLAAWFVLNTVGAVVVVEAASPEQLSSFGGAVLWHGGVGFVCTLSAAVLAALAHRAPWRLRTGRNAAAVLGGPLAAVIADAAVLAAGGSPDWGVFLVPAALSLVGAVAGWLLVRALRRTTDARDPAPRR